MRFKRCCHMWSWRPLPRPNLPQTRSKLPGLRRPVRRPTATMSVKVWHAGQTRYIYGVGLELRG